jgi:hypothetical protein
MQYYSQEFRKEEKYSYEQHSHVGIIYDRYASKAKISCPVIACYS